ncbi:hypothetical protein BIW11_10863 [Tropilaelaps mercedesae]|uniref:Pre-rRNA-processing protein Ipi1 N-terminal domain-containing protein n=1 Tax=Tropilaelaps mercedesae TaxID=418985 RepID=A0A1V9XDV0_9ACAR|nr:hypothetical protein BIW11_10863 [Tropilaelaps mercedesae]
MAGNKKAKAKDFQKVKLKVGKIKKKGLNFTDTSFKTKKIIIREQLKGAEIKGVKEQFTLAIQKLGSANPSNVTDGLNTIVRILDLLGPDQRQTLVQRLGPLTSRPEVAVRDGATSVLNRTLDKFPLEQRKNFAEKLLLNLQCAMTSLDWAVKRSSMQLLEVLLRHTPEEVARNFSILENLMDLVSSTRPGVAVRKLDMELKCSTDHLKLWRDVTGVITRLVQCIVKTFFSGEKQATSTCAGTQITPRIRWFAQSSAARRSVNHHEGGAVALAFVPVLLSMWSGIEACTTAKAMLKQDLFAHVSIAMLTIVEWADLANASKAELHELAVELTNFFKTRFPMSLESSSCADTNLRLAKVMILLHGGSDTNLNQTLFLELKREALSDARLTLDVAAMAVKNTPGVLEYVNSLFFVKKAQARRPFYKFYLSVIEKRVSDPHLDRMLRKVATFVGRIIIQYPNDCQDEVNFLERLHSYMIPAYIDGIGKLPLSALEQILRNTHKLGPMALRLILDQKMLSHQHLRIITDRWQEGDLSQEEMQFVMGHLAWKIEEIYNLMVSNATNNAVIDLHIKMVQLVAEFILCVYLDLDSDENAHFSRTFGSHSQQKHLHYFEQIHKNVLFLNADSRPSRAKLDGVTRAIVLRDDYLKDTVMDLLRELLQIWAISETPLTVSSVTLSNILHLMSAALDFDDDSLCGPVDKLINQLFVSQFLLPTPEQDPELIKTCARYYQHSELASMLQDLEQVMKSKPEECDDRLHAAFAKSTKFFLERNLIPKETHYQDLVDDAMRIADASDDSSDSVGDSCSLKLTGSTVFLYR